MKPVSQYQFALLREVSNGMVTVESLRALRDPSVWSLVRRGLIAKNKNRPGDMGLTPDGAEVYDTYMLGGVPTRKVSAPLTNRLSRLLHVARLTKR